MPQPSILEIAGRFALDAAPRSATPLAGGHINDSYVVSVGAGRRYLLQRINTRVFGDPAALMENVRRVTAHVRGALERRGVADADRRVLRVIPTRGGDSALHADGCWWRVYQYIEGAAARPTVSTPGEAAEVARAFGAFQAALADLPPPPLHEILPGFHDTPARLAAFERVVAADPIGRAASVKGETEALLSRRALAGRLIELERSGDAPRRIVHNDAKISNILFDADERAPRALCVVDLDTVMPGLSLFDFGDMVRSMATRAAEDETELSLVKVDAGLFEALASGYLAEMGRVLTSAERENLVTAGLVITYEQALRFLADDLAGDTYYAIGRPRHNLDRARTQLALLMSLEANAARLERTLREIAPTG